MMVAELDIYRVAKLLIDQCGDRAETHAQRRADALRGDDAGRTVWLGIVEAVKVLQATEPTEAVH